MWVPKTKLHFSVVFFTFSETNISKLKNMCVWTNVYSILHTETICGVCLRQRHQHHGTPPLHAYECSHGQTQGKAPHYGRGDVCPLWCGKTLSTFSISWLKPLCGVATGVSVRREGECISGWDRLRDRRGDSEGYELSRRGCVADIVISHVYALVIHATRTLLLFRLGSP